MFLGKCIRDILLRYVTFLKASSFKLICLGWASFDISFDVICSVLVSVMVVAMKGSPPLWVH